MKENKNERGNIKIVKSTAKYLLFYFIAFLVFTGIYIASFRTPLFAANHVFFYRAVSLLIITSVLFTVVVIIFARCGKLIRLAVQDVLIAVIVPLCLNMTFLSVVTVSIDRSISVFLLASMAENKERVWTEKDITDLFLNVYMDEYKAMDRRFDEQLITGSIEKKGGAYQITDKGVFLINAFRLVGSAFPIDNRFLYPEPYVPEE
ncbi:MAG: hypothetical protein LBH75_09205 [Treponema sp.]|nr:hypothetical protein [Treponema sp.]